MLQLSGTLVNRSVLSLRTSGIVAQTVGPIINPNNLKIEGFYCQDNFTNKQLILLTQDIRDQSNQGFIINDHDVLSEASELVRLADILKLKFELLNKPVVTTNKKRLGKVNDYAFDTSSMYVQKIYVGQSLLKSFSGGQLSIDRSQIVEITNRQLVVNDPLQPLKDTAQATAPAAT